MTSIASHGFSQPVLVAHSTRGGGRGRQPRNAARIYTHACARDPCIALHLMRCETEERRRKPTRTADRPPVPNFQHACARPAPSWKLQRAAISVAQSCSCCLDPQSASSLVVDQLRSPSSTRILDQPGRPTNQPRLHVIAQFNRNVR